MKRRVGIICNPISGRGRAASLAREVESALELLGFETLLRETNAPGDATRFAAELVSRGVFAAVSVGGDGTASEIARGLAGSDTPLAVCPMGTANVLAHELNLPVEPERIARLVAKGRVRRIDVGCIAGRRFIVAASAGVDAWVVRSLHESRGGAITMAHYAAPIVRAIGAYRYPPMTVEIDGQRVGCGIGYVVVANTRRYGGPLRIARRGTCDDGLFTITTARGRNLPSGLAYAAASVARMLPLVSGVKTFSGKHVRVTPDGEGEVPVQIDGDPGGNLPAEMEIVPAALPILVP